MTLMGIFSLLGGIGLFLYGMSIMSTGLKNAAGDKLRVILEHATSNRIIGALVGVLVTVLVQSSSATDMMVISFVNSGLMNLGQAIGVIMGANIGTTITAQITAFNLGQYAPVILFLGAIVFLFIKKSTYKYVGAIVMGFGMLFVGISIIKSAIAPLAESPEFIRILSGLNHPALAILFGILFTALLQSSSSSTVIFQTFAVQGLISYRVAVYLIIGAAIGSVAPNILASLTSNRNGKRTAILNLLFNIIRAALIVALINVFPQILDGIVSLSPSNIGRQIANTHTIFAVFAVIVELPFAGQIVALSQRIIPIRPEEKRSFEDRKLQYLVNVTQMPPALALSYARKEITRMGRIAENNLQMSISAFFNLDTSLFEEVEQVEDTVNYLDHAIINQLVQLRTLDLSEKDQNTVSMMTLVVADMERLSDHAENIIEYAQEVYSKRAQLSAVAVQELRELADDVLRSVDLGITIFEEEKFDLIPQAEALEQQVDDFQKEIVNNHVQRLMKAQCDPLGGVVFTDMSSDLERCSDHAINIACALSPNTNY
ncbi:MAG: Na/Pi cotransporter family protein [Oscillospiraceae bacterium]|nr:Na/Pi cotransporter family protein [Oscillospiraceae bacterium]